MFNTGNSYFIDEFSSLFLISEIANYLCVVGVLMIVINFKLVEEKYFLFWCLYFLTPFFGNYVLFDPIYAGSICLYQYFKMKLKQMDFQKLVLVIMMRLGIQSPIYHLYFFHSSHFFQLLQ